MRALGIIQARMGSTRLPGKVLMDVGGETMLGQVIRRARRARGLDEVIVATSHKESDGAVEVTAERLGLRVFRGSEEDVLDRFYHASHDFEAEAVVRLTADCPLLDPGVVDRVITSFKEELPDYASNTLRRTYPRGLDVEVMTREALRKAWDEATESYQRAHVTPYIYENSSLFRLLSVTSEDDQSHHRWTVDTPEDLKFVRAVYARLPHPQAFGWRDVLAVLAEDPQLQALNRDVPQKPLEEG